VVALVPARAGSRRVRNKNVRPLAQHPLIAYTIAAARASGIFGAVIVSTDSPSIAKIAAHYGAEVPFLRPEPMASETSPDIEWLEFTLGRLRELGRTYDAFSILRPTSPFRKPETIRRAWRQFLSDPGIDSLRAVEKCTQHPYKMWLLRGQRMEPFVKEPATDGAPWHSRPYQALPPVYVQNASLEIAWSRVVFEQRSISGRVLAPFLTEGDEGFDINNPDEWWLAENMVKTSTGTLPHVKESPFCG
jgi:N-acylneuraminate cytidylyltransferase